jgi:secondary thiamine-phosphate synthase enzyme
VRIQVNSRARTQLVDITAQVRSAVRHARLHTGLVHLWSLHTTCALTVNEGADPDVATDLATFMDRLVPEQAGFRHAEGNSDSHVKTSLFGPGLTLLVEDSELVLGTWQHVFLAEWDGPRTRTVALLLSEALDPAARQG